MTCTLQLALPPSTDVNRPLVVIVSAVLAVHAVLIGWMVLFGPSAVKPIKAAPPRKLLVQTVELAPTAPAAPPASLPKPVEKVVEAPAPLPVIEEILPEPLPEVKPEPKKVEAKKPETVKKPAPIPPKAQPAPKKEVAKPAPKASPKPKEPAVKKEVKPKAAEKPAPKPAEAAKSNEAQQAAEKLKQQALEQQRVKEAAQQAERQRQRKLLADAEERIAKIGAGHGKVDPGKSSKLASVALPSALSSLHIDALPDTPGAAPLSFKEASYRDELAGRLKLLLRLPEYGDVRVKLTLERSGKVSKVVVESSASKANGKYIEKTLPGLTFPPFGTNFGNEAHYTFSITLSNE